MFKIYRVVKVCVISKFFENQTVNRTINLEPLILITIVGLMHTASISSSSLLGNIWLVF